MHYKIYPYGSGRYQKNSFLSEKDYQNPKFPKQNFRRQIQNYYSKLSLVISDALKYINKNMKISVIKISLC